MADLYKLSKAALIQMIEHYQKKLEEYGISERINSSDTTGRGVHTPTEQDKEEWMLFKQAYIPTRGMISRAQQYFWKLSPVERAKAIEGAKQYNKTLTDVQYKKSVDIFIRDELYLGYLKVRPTMQNTTRTERPSYIKVNEEW